MASWATGSVRQFVSNWQRKAQIDAFRTTNLASAKQYETELTEHHKAKAEVDAATEETSALILRLVSLEARAKLQCLKTLGRILVKWIAEAIRNFVMNFHHNLQHAKVVESLANISIAAEETSSYEAQETQTSTVATSQQNKTLGVETAPTVARNDTENVTASLKRQIKDHDAMLLQLQRQLEAQRQLEEHQREVDAIAPPSPKLAELERKMDEMMGIIENTAAQKHRLELFLDASSREIQDLKMQLKLSMTNEVRTNTVTTSLKGNGEEDRNQDEVLSVSKPSYLSDYNEKESQHIEKKIVARKRIPRELPSGYPQLNTIATAVDRLVIRGGQEIDLGHVHAGVKEEMRTTGSNSVTPVRDHGGIDRRGAARSGASG